MSLSKHALTFLKRHYRALLQRAYVLGLAATAERRFTLIPAPHSAQPAPAYRKRPKLTVPMLVAITALSCGPGLETAAAARTEFTGDSLNGTYKHGLEIKSPGNYTVADGTNFQNVTESDGAGALYLPTPAGNYGLTFAGTAEFLENYPSNNGGAIYTQGNLTITGGSGNITFSGNSASIAGGAIYTRGNLTIRAGSGGIAFVNQVCLILIFAPVRIQCFPCRAQLVPVNLAWQNKATLAYFKGLSHAPRCTRNCDRPSH